MNLAHVRSVIRRERRELLRNKLILFTMAIVPTSLVLVTMGTEAALLSLPDEEVSAADLATMPPEMAARFSALGARAAMLVLLNEQFLSMLLIIAAALPSTIASHSVIGEKVERTLEPLLATPIATGDLLLGKCLVAVIPSAIITLMAYVVTTVAIGILTPAAVLAMAIRPVWPLAFLLLAPMIAMCSALLSILLSSRVSDPRTAQGLSGFLVIPILGMGVGSLLGAVELSPGNVLAFSAVILIANLALLQLVSRLFARETILTRWK